MSSVASQPETNDIEEQNAIARWVDEGGAGNDPVRPPLELCAVRGLQHYVLRATGLVCATLAIFGAAFWLYRTVRQRRALS